LLSRPLDIAHHGQVVRVRCRPPRRSLQLTRVDTIRVVCGEERSLALGDGGRIAPDVPLGGGIHVAEELDDWRAWDTEQVEGLDVIGGEEERERDDGAASVGKLSEYDMSN
jgi:hypothetical protein